jgi:glutamate--cysteine ligase
MEQRDGIVKQELTQRSLVDDAESTAVESKSQLVEYLESCCQSPETFALGAEHEQFVYLSKDYSPATYDGPRPGIKELLDGMTRFGWKPIEENGFPIALWRDGCTITLEPGGQFELSGAALRDAHQTAQETQTYHEELGSLAGELGLSFLALGHQPKHTRAEIPWMPKKRYRLMRDYMPSRGSLGLDMMLSTCAIQVALDFADEADMVRKFRVALALQPIVTALFANSPFADGRFSGYLSYRGAIWSDTDPDRCGSLPFVFENGMGFERYVDYVLDVPMYFVHRDGQYIDARGLSFRDFLDGDLSALPRQRPLLSDWVNHLTTVFPQVRLKQYLEMRGADAGDAVTRVPALASLWAGLLYDQQSLQAAWDRVQTWTFDERSQLESNVVKHGFETPFRTGTVRDLALWMLDLSRHGLERRNFRNNEDSDESQYLLPLQKAAEAGRTFAEELMRRYSGEWQADIDLALPAMCKETFS